MVDVPLRIVGQYDGRQIDQGMRNLNQQVQGLQRSVTGMFGAFVSIRAVQGLAEMADGAYSLQNSMIALEQQLSGTGQSLDSLMQSLREATQGQVAMVDMTASANRAIALLGQQAVPRFAELAEVAAKAASVMGIDVTQAFNDIVTGIGRQSRMILDNLGLIIDSNKAYETYATRIGKTVDELTEMERKQAFLNAALDQAHEKFDKLAAQVNPMQQLAAAWKDLTSKVEMTLVSGAGGGVSELAESIHELSENARALTTSIETVKATVILLAGMGGLIALDKSIRFAIEAVEALVLKFRMFKAAMAEAAYMENILALNTMKLQAAIFRMSLVIGALVGIYLNMGIQRKAAIAELNQEAEETISLAGKNTALIDTIRGLQREMDDLSSSQDVSIEKYQELYTRVIDLIEANPQLAEQIGYSVTAEGALIDATGNTVDSIGELQGIINSFNTDMIVGEVTRAIEALQQLSLARINAAVPDFDARAGAILQDIENNPSTLNVLSGIPRFLGLGVQYAYSSINELLFGGGTEVLDDVRRQNEQDWQALLDRVRALRRGEPPGGPGGGAGGGGGGGVAQQAETLANIMERFGDSLMENNARLEAANMLGEDTNSIMAEQANIYQRTLEELILFRDSLELIGQDTTDVEAAIQLMVAGFNMAADAAVQLSGTLATTMSKLQSQLAMIGASDQGTKPRPTGILFGQEPGVTGGSPTGYGISAGIQTAAGQIAGAGQDIADAGAQAAESVEEVEDIFDTFITQLGQTLGNFLENWGWKGGEFDLKGLMRPIAGQIGDWASSAMGIASGSFLGGIVPGLISGGIGWITNRLIGEKPLEIEQPVDIKIVDIETHLMDWFNFRGMDPFTYSSSFRTVFENGLY